MNYCIIQTMFIIAQPSRSKPLDSLKEMWISRNQNSYFNQVDRFDLSAQRGIETDNANDSLTLLLKMHNEDFTKISYLMSKHDLVMYHGRKKALKQPTIEIMYLLRFTTIDSTKIENRGFFKKTSVDLGLIGLFGNLGVGVSRG